MGSGDTLINKLYSCACVCVCMKNAIKYASESENNGIWGSDWVVISLYWGSGPVSLHMWQCDIGICVTRRMRLRGWTELGLHTALQARAGSMDFTWSTTAEHWRVSSNKRYELIYIQVTSDAVWRLVCRRWVWKQAIWGLSHSSVKRSGNRARWREIRPGYIGS